MNEIRDHLYIVNRKGRGKRIGEEEEEEKKKKHITMCYF
jgi:hypothetical protein